MFNLGEYGAFVTLNDSQYMSKMQGLDTTASSVFDRIKGYALKAFAAIGGTMFLKSTIAEFNNAEYAAKMYSSALRANGYEAGLNTIAAKNFSEEMQRLTSYEDDAVLAAMRHGLSLGIQQSAIEETTKSAMGLAERYGMDLPSAMTLLAKAQNGQTAQLARMGIALDTTKSKQEQYQQLLAIGASSFGMVTDAAKTNRGALDQLNNTYSDTKEAIGGALAPTITSLAQTLKELLLTFNSWDKSTIAAIVRTSALVAGLVLARSAYITVITFLALKTKLLAGDTAATAANTAANLANAASQKAMSASGYLSGRGYAAATVAAPVAARGLFGVNALAAGMAAKGGLMGATGGLLGTSVGSIAASGSVAVIGAAGALATATAILGFKFGKLTADITGLTPVLERTFGSWFHGLDAIEARSADLDKKLQDLNKARQAKLEKQRVDAELVKAKKEYGDKIGDADFENQVYSADFRIKQRHDPEDVKTKVKLLGEKAAELMNAFLAAPGNSPEELEKKAAMYDKALAMQKRYDQALEEFDSERQASVKTFMDEQQKSSSRRLNYLEAGLREDGKFDMADEARLAGARLLEQERKINEMRLKQSQTHSLEEYKLWEDTISAELVELGKLREEARKSVETPRDKYAGAMSSYVGNIENDKTLTMKERTEAILSANAENRALFEKFRGETDKSNPKSSKEIKDGMAMKKLIDYLDRNAKAVDRKQELETLKEIEKAIKAQTPGSVTLQ